ncbi:hypothetical protein [Aequorivita ciconiae]|nr:hypothetical protein [Aequorivita sp. H23M31]
MVPTKTASSQPSFIALPSASASKIAAVKLPVSKSLKNAEYDADI